MYFRSEDGPILLLTSSSTYSNAGRKHCRRYVGRLGFEFSKQVKIHVRIERVRVLKIRSVLLTVHDGAELADEVLALDVAYEAILHRPLTYSRFRNS